MGKKGKEVDTRLTLTLVLFSLPLVWAAVRLCPTALSLGSFGGAEDGNKYVYDAFGDRWSRLTFLVYLNEDFSGGSTTFYTPAPEQGRLEAYSVQPRCGSVLVFPHGGDHGSLVHEGSHVGKGAKYVNRLAH